MSSVKFDLAHLELALDQPELPHLHYLVSTIALKVNHDDPTLFHLSFTPARVNTIITYCLRWLHHQEAAYLAIEVLEYVYDIAAGIGLAIDGTMTVRVIMALDEVKPTRPWFRDMVARARISIYLLALPLALVFYHMAVVGEGNNRDIAERLFHATIAVSTWTQHVSSEDRALIQQLFQQIMLRLPRKTLKHTRTRLDAIYDETFAPT